MAPASRRHSTPAPAKARPSSPMRRLLLVDAHPVFRDGLRRALDERFTIVGEAATGTLAVRLAMELQPDVAIIDIDLPDGDGIAVIRQIAERVPATGVIVLTLTDDRETVRAAEQAGAQAFLSKSLPAGDITRAIEQPRGGGATGGIPS